MPDQKPYTPFSTPPASEPTPPAGEPSPSVVELSVPPPPSEPPERPEWQNQPASEPKVAATDSQPQFRPVVQRVSAQEEIDLSKIEEEAKQTETKELPEMFESSPTTYTTEVSEPAMTIIPPPVEETVPPSLVEAPPPSPPTTLSGELPAAPKRSILSRLIKPVLVIFLIALIALAVWKIVLPRLSTKIVIGKPITLTYWGLWEPDSVLKEVIAEWEKKHPGIKINYQLQSSKEYRERIQSALARGEGPDIFRYHITWVPMFKNELAAVPSSFMSQADYEAAYYPVVLSQLNSSSGYLGVPLMMDTMALFYNEEIFQAADKKPPTSWDEVRQLAVDLTTKEQGGRISIAGIALGTTGNVDHWSDILGLMMLQNGADLNKPVGSLAEDALTYYTIFSSKDKVWDDTMPSSTVAFAGGKAAMYLGPSWRVFNIKDLNPQLKFKIVPVPQLPGTKTAWATFWVEGVSKRSTHAKEAWEFLAYLSSKETLQKLYQAQSKTRLFGEFYPRKDMANLLLGDPIAAPFVEQFENAQTWYLCSRTADNGINDRMIKYYEDAVNALNQGSVAKIALQTVSNGVTQLLSQYGLSAPAVR